MEVNNKNNTVMEKTSKKISGRKKIFLKRKEVFTVNPSLPHLPKNALK